MELSPAEERDVLSRAREHSVMETELEQAKEQLRSYRLEVAKLRDRLAPQRLMAASEDEEMPEDVFAQINQAIDRLQNG